MPPGMPDTSVMHIRRNLSPCLLHVPGDGHYVRLSLADKFRWLEPIRENPLKIEMVTGEDLRSGEWLNVNYQTPIRHEDSDTNTGKKGKNIGESGVTPDDR